MISIPATIEKPSPFSPTAAAYCFTTCQTAFFEIAHSDTLPALFTHFEDATLG